MGEKGVCVGEMSGCVVERRAGCFVGWAMGRSGCGSARRRVVRF